MDPWTYIVSAYAIFFLLFFGYIGNLICQYRALKKRQDILQPRQEGKADA